MVSDQWATSSGNASVRRSPGCSRNGNWHSPRTPPIVCAGRGKGAFRAVDALYGIEPGLGRSIEAVRQVFDLSTNKKPTDNLRSYRVSSEKNKARLGFAASHGIGDAVGDLVAAFAAGRVPNSMTDPRYYNIKTMQQVDLR